MTAGVIYLGVFHACVVIALLAPRWLLELLALCIVLPALALVVGLAIDPVGMTDRFPELLKEIAEWLPSL